jgi:hypothetical protein
VNVDAIVRRASLCACLGMTPVPRGDILAETLTGENP